MNIEEGKEGEIEFSGFVTCEIISLWFFSEETGVVGFWWHQVKKQGHVCTSVLGSRAAVSVFGF